MVIQESYAARLTRLWSARGKPSSSKDLAYKPKLTSVLLCRKTRSERTTPSNSRRRNPQLAYQALQVEPEISLLLPCSVTVRQSGPNVEVSVIDAEKLMQFVGKPELKPLAVEAKRRLQAVLENI